MNYEIRELEEFSVIGQEIELTKFQRENIEISKKYWQTFNMNLKKSYLSQQGNWVKYAFMERKNEKLFYYCAIPQRVAVPEGFEVKKIKSGKYLVGEHLGSMDRIYDSYTKIYQEIIPGAGYIPFQTDFLHFERFDHRFHWNNENSIIEIWVPIVL